MAEHNRADVMAALDIVLEEIEAEIELVNRDGSRMFESGDYDNASDALKRAAQITALRDKVDAIRREWQTLAPETEKKWAQRNRKGLGRLRRGERTPEDRYYHPILEALRSLGGSGTKSEVLERVHERLQCTLKEVDFEPVGSSPDTPRWTNTAAWARNTLVEKGLLRNDSRRGIWEISDSGIRFLQEGKDS